jgi:hypothetical protein
MAISWYRGTRPIQKTTGARLWWVPVAAIPLVVLFLLFPISRPIWYLLPQWRYLQYPWRWLEAVEAPTAIFIAAAVWPAARRKRAIVAAACGAAFLAATACAGISFFQVCYPEDTVASTLAAYRAGTGFEGMYEYEPPGADRSEIAMGLPDACLVSDPMAALGKEDADGDIVWSAAQGSCEATFPATRRAGWSNSEQLRIGATTPRAGYLVLRLLSYPAWRVTVNGQLVKDLPARADGLMDVPVPDGPIDLRVDWTTTSDVVAGRCATGFSVLLLLGLFLLERRRGRL